MRLNGRTVILAALAGMLIAGSVHAQSSLGIGNNEVVAAPSGPFASLLAWINSVQKSYYRDMTEALRAMRESGSAVWLLAGLSFAYGIFHAAGPGHGKAVISSYMLANEVELRRGVMLSFVSAFLQAVTAIAVVGAAYLLLRGTSVKMTDATHFMEVASYALILAFGLWLLWQKTAYWRTPALAHAPQDHGHHHGHAHHHDDHGHHHHHHHHHHHEGEVCDTCGHVHAADPKALGGSFDWKTAWTAIAAVGMRPCSGALIVLTFAFLNGLVLGGVISAFAMALGTGITVAVLATLAVTAKNTALKFAGDGAFAVSLHRWIEIGGAALVALLGFLLLSAALYG